MRQILSKSGPLVQQLHSSKLGSKQLRYSFSAMPPNMCIQKAVEFQFKFRSILKLSQLNDYLMQNKQDIKKYGKTILLQFLNEYPMQSFRRSRDELDSAKREQKYKMRNKIYMFLIQLEDLNFYELNMRYSILKKLITYVGQDMLIIEEVNRTEQMLVKLLKQGDLHVSDIMNWLYMLPLNYKQEHSCLAFDLLEAKFEQPQVREYFRNQRSLPALIKRIYQLDWSRLRKYKNILKFFCHEASARDVDSLEQIVNQLERLVLMKLHLVGEKVMPKMVDEIIEKFQSEFQILTKNKQTLLRVFSLFKHLPLNYNIKFFNKIHNFLKTTKQLPSHLLIYLPYNKLTSTQIAYLQSKMFAVGREDIASKLIYTIYTPDYRDALTPFIIKEAYTNLLEMWKKDGGRVVGDYQIYLSVIFRFAKINHPIIDQSKLREIFSRIVRKVEQQNYDVFNTFSFPAIIAFIELCAHYDIHFNEKALTFKFDNVLKSRKQKNSLVVYTDFLISAIKVHHNSNHRKSKYFLTQFVTEIANNPQVDFTQRIQLLFLIEKTINPDPKWIQASQILRNQLTQDIHSFIQVYIKYDHKTLNLTNFIFNVLYQKKVNFSTVMEILSSLNLKLITSLKGKLIPSLKKYLNEMDLAKFDISQTSMGALVHSLKLLFYFKNEIPEFMEYFSIKIIQKIQLKLKEGEHINGKQFALLSNYIMEVVKHIEIKKKTSIIQSIVSIIKTLRKKEGIYLKVYELDFLCSNQKYIKINKDVLDLHWNDIIATLKKTDRIEHHKDLMLIIIKLHCRQFVELTPSDLRYFTQNCTEMIQRSVLNLSEIKQCLGYDILECENDLVIQKMKIYLSALVKLAFRKDKRKKNYFMYEYYLRFFSKLQIKEMIVEICEKLLYEKLYPLEISNIVPILNQNQIKNKKFIKRILQIMSLGQSYVTFQKMQVLSWLEKISYDLPQTDSQLNKMKNKVHQEILQKISALKLFLKNQLTLEDRSIESGFEVQDPNFDKNYKIFIEYAWTSLKYKNHDSPQMKFICRYLFFSLQKIKGRIENPEERKQISKIKLYHVLKYIKEMGFFDIDKQKIENAIREKNILMQKARKTKILNKMEKDLGVMKIQKCEKLQNKLAEFNGLINVKAKQKLAGAEKKEKTIVEYYIQEKTDKNKSIIKNKFVIHTVKKYHITAQSDSLPQEHEYSKDSISQTKKHQADDSSLLKPEEIDILEMGLNEHAQDIELDEKHMQKSQDQLKDTYIEEPYHALELKPEKEVMAQKGIKQEKEVRKPLFSQQKSKKTQEKPSMPDSPLKFETVLKIQKPTQELCRDYNGYLKVEKSLIELSTGLKCVIYDPQRNIFFD